MCCWCSVFVLLVVVAEMHGRKVVTNKVKYRKIQTQGAQNKGSVLLLCPMQLSLTRLLALWHPGGQQGLTWDEQVTFVSSGLKGVFFPPWTHV